MTTRRSIFKLIPAMIAAAVMPKAWTARALEPSVGQVTLHEGMIHPYPQFKIADLPRTFSSSTTWAFDAGDTSGWMRNAYTGGPIRLFVDDPDGFSTEVTGAFTSMSITE